MVDNITPDEHNQFCSCKACWETRIVTMTIDSKAAPPSSKERSKDALLRSAQMLVSLSQRLRCTCQATAGYTHHCEACRALRQAEINRELLSADASAHETVADDNRPTALTPLEQLLADWWSTDMDDAELFNRAVRTSRALADAMQCLPVKAPGEPCPVPAADGMSVDGKQLAPDVWGIGTVSWHPETQDWRCLANVSGCLCVVQVRLRPQLSENGEGK